MRNPHRPFLAAAFTIFVLVATPVGLSAQQPIKGPRPSGSRLVHSTVTGSGLADRQSSQSHGLLGDGSKDYRYRGALIGALIPAIPGVVLFAACGQPGDFCDRGMIARRLPFMVVVSGLIGALVGASISK